MKLIAGPCVVESKDELKKSIESILEAVKGKDIDFTFKSSFKKDNRTLSTGFSGLCEKEALSLLQEIKNEYNVKICTDVHNVEHLLMEELKFVDVIQIPAYLAKQQSLLKASAYHCKVYDKQLHIKKPQFVSPWEMKNIVNNVLEFGAKDIILTDRGTMLGYDKVFMDPRHIEIMKENNMPVLWDITHPNKGWSGNQTKRIKTLGVTALAAGADGLFLETHPNCKEALCDSEVMLYNNELKKMINKFYRLWEFINEL